MAFMDFAAKDETQLQVLFPFPLGAEDFVTL